MSSRTSNPLNLIRCENTRRVMRAALDVGFEWVGYTKSGHIEIRWPATDERLFCATTPSDRNAWKRFAKDVARVSGAEVWRKGNRRRSRKPVDTQDPQVEAQRRRYALLAAKREESRRRRAAAVRAAAADDRRRREIESLMRPGWGRG